MFKSNLIRKWFQVTLVAVLMLGVLLLSNSSRAAPAAPDLDLPLPNVIVNTTAIADDPNDGKCDLWEALQAVFQANYGMSPTYHECTAKENAKNIIAFSVVGGTITLPTAPGSRTDLPFVHGDTVILGPIAIAGGSGGDTHLLRTAPDATLTVIAVSLKDGHTSGSGPAIYSDNGASVNVIGSFLVGNVADNDGGAIYANGNLNLIGTSFINNRANGSPGRGGAVYMTGSGSFKSEASTFTGNKANAGGAVYIEKSSGDASISESIFTANIVTGDANGLGGGAVFNYGGQLDIQRTAFNANLGVQGQGGALVNNTNAVVTVTNTLFDGNIAGDTGLAMDGGAIKNLGNLVVGKSTFVGNVAQGGSGGAIAAAANGQVSIANSTFSANVASVQGGALFITGTAQTMIRNSTFANNQANTDASAIYALGTTQVKIGNTIIDGGTSLKSNCFKAGITSLGHNIDTGTSCGLTAAGDMNTTNPLLNALNFNGGSLPVLTTHLPSYDSPAVDHGDPAICGDPAVNNEDEIGTKRPQDANNTGNQSCDIGAVELKARKPAFNAVPMPPGPINLGSIQINTTLTMSFTVSDSGNDVLKLNNPSLDDTAHFSLATTFPITLNVGEQTALVVGCKPTSTGPLTGTLSFGTNDPDKPSVAYTLLCNGTPAAQPVFASLPPSVMPVELGDVTVGQAMTKSITVENIGKATLSVTNAGLSGSSGLSFAMALPFNVAAGASKTFSVTCQPGQVGALAGYLHLTTNDLAQPGVDFTLNCTGVAPVSDDLTNLSNLKYPFLPSDLTNPFGLATSPDSMNTYVTGDSTAGGQVVVLKKSTSGALAGYFLPTGQALTSTLLTRSYSAAVSPDGKYVLATGALNNALVSYKRDSGDGSLTYLGAAQSGSGGVTGLSYPVDVAYSPDGQFAYVASYVSNSIAIFKQVTTTASNLSFVGVVTATTMTTHTLNGPNGIAVSPDGKNVYVAAYGGNALAVYRRDVKTGLLTPIQTRFQGDIQDTPGCFICFSLNGLNGAFHVTVSPDGRNVYATGQTNNALVTFSRDPVTGMVRWYNSIIDNTGADGLRAARGVAVSPDGKYVFTLGQTDQAMTMFNRDKTTGALTLRRLYKRDAGSGTPALDGASDLALTNDRQYVFASAMNDKAVVVFEAANPVPTLSSLQPASVVAGSGDFTLVVKGSGFVNGAYVWWDSYHPTTTYMNSTELRASIPATWITTAGPHTIGVHNFAPGGGDSFNSLTFQVTLAALAAQADRLDPLSVAVAAPPIPSIDHLNPAGVKAGPVAATVDIYGTNFLNTSQVLINNMSAASTYIDSTHLQVNVGANKLAQPGTVNVRVSDGAGSVSNLVGLDVATPGQNPLPSITSLSPNWVWSYGASSKPFTLLVTGKNFVEGATVQWNGEDRPTQFVDSTHLRATISSLDQFSPGPNGVTVVNPTPGGGASNTMTYVVHPLYRVFAPIIKR